MCDTMARMRLAALVMLLMGISASAWALPRRFNLICTSAASHLNGHTMPEGHFLYTFDLRQMRWCSSTCTEPERLRTQAHEYVLSDSNLPVAGTVVSERFDANALVMNEFVQSAPGRTTSWQLRCRIPPFSGIHPRPEPY